MTSICINQETEIGWNIVQAAGSYSQLTGIMAAVVFAAIVLALGNPPTQKSSQTGAPHRLRSRASSHALIGLPVVFAGMLLCSLLYAILDGEQECKRAFALAVFASGAFAIAALTLIVSISWLLAAYDVDPQVIINVKATYGLLVLIAILYMVVTVGDGVNVLRGHESSTAETALISFLISIPQVAAVGWRRIAKSVGAGHEWPSSSFYQHAMLLIIGVIALLGVAFGFVSNMKSSQAAGLFSIWMRIGFASVVGIGFALLSLNLPSSRSSESG